MDQESLLIFILLLTELIKTYTHTLLDTRVRLLFELQKTFMLMRIRDNRIANLCQRDLFQDDLLRHLASGTPEKFLAGSRSSRVPILSKERRTNAERRRRCDRDAAFSSTRLSICDGWVIEILGRENKSCCPRLHRDEKRPSQRGPFGALIWLRATYRYPI